MTGANRIFRMQARLKKQKSFNWIRNSYNVYPLPSRYLGGVFDIESLVEKLLQQLASKQTILVNVYDVTKSLHPISMYGSNASSDGLQHVSALNFGDPLRKHEMHCR